MLLFRRKAVRNHCFRTERMLFQNWIKRNLINWVYGLYKATYRYTGFMLPEVQRPDINRTTVEKKSMFVCHRVCHTGHYKLGLASDFLNIMAYVQHLRFKSNQSLNLFMSWKSRVQGLLLDLHKVVSPFNPLDIFDCTITCIFHRHILI